MPWYGAELHKVICPNISNRQVASLPRQRSTPTGDQRTVGSSLSIVPIRKLNAIRPPSGSQETQFLVRVQRRKPLPRYGAELHRVLLSQHKQPTGCVPTATAVLADRRKKPPYKQNAFLRLYVQRASSNSNKVRFQKSIIS